MPDYSFDLELLRRFEEGLDPRHPERGEIPARVLGYGEISTVLEIGSRTQSNLAYKRMPLFHTEQEADSYRALHTEYVLALQGRIGLRIASGDVVRIVDEQKQRIVVYIIQDKLPSSAIGHIAIHHISHDDVGKLILAVLRETAKVFDFNRHNRHWLELGLDGQMSNWAIANFDPQSPSLDDDVELIYFDTSTPLLRKNGAEQLNPELFLRSAPSFLVWILRLFFLEDVMTRYYDFRKVTVDIVANFIKEQRPDLVPGAIETVNTFFSSDSRWSRFEPITLAEVKSYYREDAWIWRLYLGFRKFDRSLHRVVGKHYAYILPEKIKR